MLSEQELLIQQQSNRLSYVLSDGETLHPGNGKGLHYYAFIVGKVRPHLKEGRYGIRRETDSYQIVPFHPERITARCRLFIPEVVSIKETGRKPQWGDIALFVTEGHWFGNRVAVMLYPPINNTQNGQG